MLIFRTRNKLLVEVIGLDHAQVYSRPKVNCCRIKFELAQATASPASKPKLWAQSHTSYQRLCLGYITMEFGQKILASN